MDGLYFKGNLNSIILNSPKDIITYLPQVSEANHITKEQYRLLIDLFYDY